MLTVESAKNPSFVRPDNSGIYLDVKFAEFDEVLPFTATPFDPMPYGVDLYNRAIAGEFGPIEPFVVSEKTQPVTEGAQTL